MTIERNPRPTLAALALKRAPRRRISRGQALIEFALIFFPLLMLLVVGATDTSTLIDNHLTVVYAARAGARVGSVIGNFSPVAAPNTADCAIIGAVQAALASTRNIQVSQIAIYQYPPSGVDQATAGYSQNMADQDIYAGNAVCNANGTITPAASKMGWPPSQRTNTPFTEDSIGVEITYTYTYSFNLLNIGSPVVNDAAVMPIEIVVNTGAPTPTP